MSVDYCATAIIGVRLSEAQLMEEITVPAFPHTREYEKGTKFDPKTGRELWTTETRPKSFIADYDEDYGTGKIAGFHLYRSNDYDGHTLGFFISMLPVKPELADEIHRIELPSDFDFDAARLVLRAALTPLGLWDESAFGLWSIFECH